MTKFVIAVHGDNDRLHAEALKAACEAVERVNGRCNVYRAWIEKTAQSLPEIQKEAISSMQTEGDA